MEVHCYALLFADRILREDNGKFGLIGVFEQFFAVSVPFQPLPWGIFVAFDNVSAGQYVVTVNLVHDETQSVVLPITVNLDQKGQGPVQLPLAVPALRFPAYGVYSLTVNLNGTQIGSRTLTVKKAESPPINV